MELHEDLSEALRRHEDTILKVWVERTLSSYKDPVFFSQGKDRFANPVGANVREGLAGIYGLLIRGEEDLAAYAGYLDQLIRIRAVQEISPGQAVAPVLELRWVVRTVLGKHKDDAPLIDLLQDFDLQVERLALAAFDLYTRCREQIYQARIRELKSGAHILTDSPCPSKLAKTAEN